jgi:hypothetical protein
MKQIKSTLNRNVRNLTTLDVKLVVDRSNNSLPDSIYRR